MANLKITTITVAKTKINDDNNYEFDKTNDENTKQLNQLIQQFNETDVECSNIDSNYLMNPININIMTEDNKNECKLKECKCFIAINKILNKYYDYIKRKQQKLNDNDNKNDAEEQKESVDDTFYDSNYNNTNLLNDFNHLLFCHSNEFEDIYNFFVVQNDNHICDLFKCLMIRRNHRDRSIENKHLYFNNNDHHNIIQQQLIDRIHSYYCHSFDRGYKITKREKQQIIDAEMKNDDDDNVEDNAYDLNVDSIDNLIKAKQKKYCNVSGLNRSNNKFTLSIDEEKQNENEYSYGRRYFYWPYYKNTEETEDYAHFTSGISNQPQPEANPNYKLSDWYVEAKYDSFKDELLFNEVCAISLAQWNTLLLKAKNYIDTDNVREIFCPRDESAECFDMEYGETITLNHLIAIMIYCNLDALQSKFTETYRYKKNETDDEMKQRHRNFYYLGKLLRECVECFGMLWTNKLIFDITLYHGVNKYFTFSSLNAFVKGPISTTTDFAVAVNFCGNKGMVLEMNVNAVDGMMKYNEGIDAQERLNCFDCSWISDFVSEQEIFFIGGLSKFTFNTIIEAPKGKNYCKYVKGLNQMTYFMSNGDSSNLNNKASSTEEKQTVFRLLSHELHRYYPDDPNSHEFKSCPEYFKNILHSHCQNIKRITFFDEGDEGSQLHEFLFKYDNKWIKLDLILKIFSNTKVIHYAAEKKDVSFLKQSSIYQSVLQFIKSNHNTKLEKIEIGINPAFQEEMEIYIAVYKNDFDKYLWNIRIRVIDNVHQEIEESVFAEHGHAKKEALIEMENITIGTNM